MAKYYGEIGFAGLIEKRKGQFVDGMIAKDYSGDVLENNRRLQNSDQLNDNIVVNDKISIVADPYANENFFSIRYLEYHGYRWKVTNVDVRYPRLILTLGGVYNGEKGIRPSTTS